MEVLLTGADEISRKGLVKRPRVRDLATTSTELKVTRCSFTVLFKIRYFRLDQQILATLLHMLIIITKPHLTYIDISSPNALSIWSRYDMD